MHFATEIKLDEFPRFVFENRSNQRGDPLPWTIEQLHDLLGQEGTETTKRTVERSVLSHNILPQPLTLDTLRDERDRPVKRYAGEHLIGHARHSRNVSLFVQLHSTPSGACLIAANDGRNARRWIFLDSSEPSDENLVAALRALCGDTAERTLLWPHAGLCARFRKLADPAQKVAADLATALAAYHPAYELPLRRPADSTTRNPAEGLSHLDRLEAESIHIMREVVATAQNPVMLYSVGKDSSVMLHLARKAFYPAPPPFPLLHVDTGWKFQEMYQFRDRMAADAGMQLIIHRNPDGEARNINPLDHGSAVHTDIMKTQGLKQALDHGGYDVAFGGARRDEEKSRAKERIFSFRSKTHRWDPRNQRPELWNLYNTAIRRGESIRAFPISNWTELDVWQYIHREQIPIVPLYFAANRPYVERDGMLVMLDDDRLQPIEGEEVRFGEIRFRTLGCYPLTGGFESDAEDLEAIILELLQARNSERQGRAIDCDAAESMEKKKQEGYF